jgi:hypothetical protein
MPTLIMIPRVPAEWSGQQASKIAEESPNEQSWNKTGRIFSSSSRAREEE